MQEMSHAANIAGAIWAQIAAETTRDIDEKNMRARAGVVHPVSVAEKGEKTRVNGMDAIVFFLTRHVDARLSTAPTTTVTAR